MIVLFLIICFRYSEEEEESEIEENSERPAHSRSNTNTKFASSDDKNKINESSESSGFDNMKEIDSDEENNMELFSKKHTLKVVVKSESENSDETNDRAGNALLRALNRRKVQNILELNAATNKIPETEPVVFDETLGLDEKQLEYYHNSTCLFRYNDTWRANWDLFIMGLAIWNCFVIPIEVAFEPSFLNNFIFTVINSLIDFLFLIDIFVVFRTSYVESYTGEEILYSCAIAKNYLFGRFWIDLLATIPFDLIGLLILGGNNKELQIFGILKLVRIARLSKIISYLNVKEDFKLMLKLFKLIFFLVMYLHLLGCTWFLIVNQDKEWIPPLDYVYVTTTFFADNTFYKYWMSVYHAVLILTGNDVGPRFQTFQVIF